MSAHVTYHLRITGRVQGVSYRAWTVRTAQDLGLAGWVRNRSDGSVECVVEGPQAVVDTFIAACRKGPSMARVDEVDVRPDSPLNTTGFQQLPTATA